MSDWDWIGEDHCYCLNHNCDEMKCWRNPKTIKLPIPHSFSNFEGKPQYCMKARKEDGANTD